MSQIDPHIEKGRRRLKLLIALGVVIPIGMALLLFFPGFQRFDLRELKNFLFLKNEVSVFSLFFLLLSMIGLLIGRAMYKGKEWAHAFWNSIGLFGGGIIFLLSLVTSMDDTRTGLPFLFVSTVILIITLQTALHKGVRAYLKSLRSSNSIEDKIEEIGK